MVILDFKMIASSYSFFGGWFFSMAEVQPVHQFHIIYCWNTPEIVQLEAMLNEEVSIGSVFCFFGLKFNALASFPCPHRYLIDKWDLVSAEITRLCYYFPASITLCMLWYCRESRPVAWFVTTAARLQCLSPSLYPAESVIVSRRWGGGKGEWW